MPGEPIEVKEEGTTVEVTFDEEPGEEPEIGTIKTKACVHPSKFYHTMPTRSTDWDKRFIVKMMEMFNCNK